MDSKKIVELLEKYWECQTSLEEEALLKEYFNGGDVDDKYADVADLFRYYTTEKEQVVLGDDFDNRILNHLSDNKASKPVKEGKIVKFFADALKVAAVGLILVTAGYFIKQEMEKENAQPLLTDTFDDPQKAFEETKKALQLISKNFNKGRKQAKKVATFNEAQEKVKENNL